ncbi:MAG: hypothetical protein Q9M36_13090 [Sulfurovum sp.]|nr:hypothetical protein [Sulfurovum sp.]
MKIYKSIVIFLLISLYPYSSLSANSSDFWQTLAILKSVIIDENKPKHDIQSMVKRLEQLVSEKEKLKKQNNDFRKETYSMKNEINKLYLANKELFKELEIYKPQNLPIFKPKDIRDKHFNIERIFRLRSANCFDFNGDMSCMYRTFKLDDNRTAYFIYKANRVFDLKMKLDTIMDKEGYIVNILTRREFKNIKKWERNNPDLLILLSTY